MKLVISCCSKRSRLSRLCSLDEHVYMFRQRLMQRNLGTDMHRKHLIEINVPARCAEPIRELVKDCLGKLRACGEDYAEKG
jgi:hypothetical protein